MASGEWETEKDLCMEDEEKKIAVHLTPIISVMW